MAKQKVSAKAVAADIRSGMSAADLMEKYGLSPSGLDHVFQRLIEHSIVTASHVPQIGPVRQGTDSPRDRAHSAESAHTAVKPPLDRQTAEAIAHDVRSGKHAYDIRMRFHLGPEEFQALMDNLVSLGYLSSEEVAARKLEKLKQCPYCVTLVPAGTDRCEMCGRTLARTTRAAMSARAGKAEEALREDRLEDQVCAWEDYSNNRGNRGLVRSYFVTLLRCVASSTFFFSKLPLDGSYWPAALFGATCSAVPVASLVFWIELLTGTASAHGWWALTCLTLTGLLLGFVIGGVSVYLWSLFVHGCLMLLSDDRKSFRTTFRVVSYSQAPLWCGLMPVPGGLLGNLWGLYLTGTGLRETHKANTRQAFAAVGIPACGFLAACALILLVSMPWEDVSRKHPVPGRQLKTVASSSGTEFSSYDGKFSISSPVTLKEMKQELHTAAGTMDAFVFSGVKGFVQYAVVYGDTPSQMHYLQYLPFFSRSYDPQKMLDQMPAGIASRLGGNVISATHIVLNNNPGREILIQAPKKFGEDVRMKTRLLLVKNRIYEIMVAAPNEQLNSKEVNDFFDSFALHP